MATNFMKKGKLPTFVALAFRNGMGYCYLNVHINSVNDASISCKNFVNFGPELTELINFWSDTGKNGHSVEYLRTDFCNLFTI